MNPVTDLASFVQNISLLVSQWELPNADWYPMLWFRGQQDATWKLQPGWHRVTPTASGPGDEWYTEATLFQEFRHRAPQYLPTIPATDWEWLFLMQHYGLPTRLLDWTHSALTGLYFALRDNTGTADAAVWVLNPWWLNKQTLGDYVLPYTGDPCLEDWAAHAGLTAVKNDNPVAMKPIHSNPRIAAQRGLFTIHGSDADGLERLTTCTSDRGPQLCRITIPKEYCVEIRRDLSIAGVTETTAFPELDGLCREIKSYFFGF